MNINFDGLITMLILVGIVVGLGLAGLIKLLIWLFGHISITWVG